jgi:ankyrin repeat protein
VASLSDIGSYRDSITQTFPEINKEEALRIIFALIQEKLIVGQKHVFYLPHHQLRDKPWEYFAKLTEKYTNNRLSVETMRDALTTTCSQNIIRLLVEYGAVIDTNNNGFTALYYALREYRFENMQTLLVLGANPFIQIPTGRSIFVLENFLNVYNQIYYGEKTQRNILHAAAELFDLSMVMERKETLLDRLLYDINKTTEEGETRLQIEIRGAQETGYTYRLTNMLNTLLREGSEYYDTKNECVRVYLIDINAKDERGQTALTVALNANRPNNVVALLNAGALCSQADISVGDEHWQTLLISALKANNQNDVITLLNAGAPYHSVCLQANGIK